MGVDYTGHYGIGVKVHRKDFNEDSEYYEDFNTYLDDLTGDSNYHYFEVGQGNYSGEENDIYICIDNPFIDGFCALGEKADKLIQFLQENKIDFEGKVGIVGGLEVW